MEKREPIFNVTGFEVLLGIVVGLFAAGLFGAFAVLFYQSMDWLKTGAWHPLPADWAWDAVGLHLPVTNMVGAERIIEWFVWVASPAPLAMTSVLVGILPFVVTMFLLNWIRALNTDIANNRAKRAARKQRL